MKQMVLFIAASLGAGWSEPAPSPAPCLDNAQCAEGSFCEVPTGECVESGFCQTDADCFDGMTCDERMTCVPEEPPPPLPACEEITTELGCLVRADCNPIYVGVRCTCDGVPCACTPGNPGCVCEKYEFAGCVSL